MSDDPVALIPIGFRLATFEVVKLPTDKLLQSKIQNGITQPLQPTERAFHWNALSVLDQIMSDNLNRSQLPRATEWQQQRQH